MATKTENMFTSDTGGGKDATELTPRGWKIMLTFAVLGDLGLYLLFRDEIPHRDYLMCRVGLILIIFLTSFESRRPRKRLTSKRFRKTFATLSAMEVVFTIVLPWMIILQGIMNIDKKETSRNGHLFAPHLFIFQAQIAFECIIVLAGEQRKWLMFPFTCVSNAYRGITLGTWIMRVMNEDLQPVDMNYTCPSYACFEAHRHYMLPLIATALWMYSSFIFIPTVWYPLIRKKP